MTDQNIRDRYYGVNDELATRVLDKVAQGTAPRAGDGSVSSGEQGVSAPGPLGVADGGSARPPSAAPSRAVPAGATPPADATVRTLCVGGLDPSTAEADVRDATYALGELEAVRVLPQKRVAFVTFATRQVAELAARRAAAGIAVKGRRCRVVWGRPAPPTAQGGAGKQGAGGLQTPYPSMDPRQLGSSPGGQDEVAREAQLAAEEEERTGGAGPESKRPRRA